MEITPGLVDEKTVLSMMLGLLIWIFTTVLAFIALLSKLPRLESTGIGKVTTARGKYHTVMIRDGSWSGLCHRHSLSHRLSHDGCYDCATSV